MDVYEYVKNASRTRSNLDDQTLDILHMLLGMQTEVGELADPFKKNMAYKKKIDYVNVKEEIGDLMWYVANLCDILDFNLEEIMITNIEKLKTRFPEKYSHEKATSRNLDKEREILEKLGYRD